MSTGMALLAIFLEVSFLSISTMYYIQCLVIIGLRVMRAIFCVRKSLNLPGAGKGLVMIKRSNIIRLR